MVLNEPSTKCDFRDYERGYICRKIFNALKKLKNQGCLFGGG